MAMLHEPWQQHAAFECSVAHNRNRRTSLDQLGGTTRHKRMLLTCSGPTLLFQPW